MFVQEENKWKIAAYLSEYYSKFWTTDVNPQMFLKDVIVKHHVNIPDSKQYI